jgi:hypothetical protein
MGALESRLGLRRVRLAIPVFLERRGRDQLVITGRVIGVEVGRQ